MDQDDMTRGLVQQRTYAVRAPIKHAGDRIATGGTVTMPPALAEPLVRAGYLALIPAPSKRKAGAKQQLNQRERK